MRPPTNLDAPEYNLEQPLRTRAGKFAQKYASKVGGILLVTAVLSEQTIIESKGNPDGRYLGNQTSQEYAPQESSKIYTNNIGQKNTPTYPIEIPKNVFDNPEIVHILGVFGMFLDDSDTNQTIHEKLGVIIGNMQLPENNSEAAIFSIREEIRLRLEAGYTNTPSLMKALEILKRKQKNNEEIIQAYLDLKNADEVGKMNEALIRYYDKNAELGNYEDWNTIISKIEEDRKDLKVIKNKENKICGKIPTQV